MDKQQAVAIGMGVSGMLDEPQLGFLYELAAMAPDGPSAECGVYHGRSIASWAWARMGKGPVYGIDNWTSRGTAHDVFAANMAQVGLDIHVIDGDSWDAPAMIGEPVAFCFVDSCHGIMGIARDIVVWPDAIMPGGILAFHDYGTWKPTVAVKAVVDAWQAWAQWEQIGDVVSSTIAFKRPA